LPNLRILCVTFKRNDKALSADLAGEVDALQSTISLMLL